MITDRAREMKGESVEEEVAEIIAQMVKATFRPTAMPIETRPRRTSVFFYPPRISSISARVHGPISPTHQGRSASRSCCFRNPPAVNFVFFFFVSSCKFFLFSFFVISPSPTFWDDTHPWIVVWRRESDTVSMLLTQVASPYQIGLMGRKNVLYIL